MTRADWHNLLRHPAVPAIAAMLAIVAIGAVRYSGSGFGSPAMLVSTLNDAAYVGVAALGATIVILSGGIDLSVGAFAALASIIVAVLIERYQLHPISAFGVAIASTSMMGGGSGLLIRVTGLPPFIVTLAAMFLARGVAYMISLEPVPIQSDAHVAIAATSVKFLGVRWSGAALTWIVLSVGVSYALAFTRPGRMLFAVGGSASSARMMGIPTGRVVVGAYAASGACAGIAGVLLTLYLSSGTHNEGVGLELDAIAAAVIGGAALAGGVGSSIGTFIGVMVVTLITVAVTTYEPRPLTSGSTKVIIGAALLAFVIMQRVLRHSSGNRP